MNKWINELDTIIKTCINPNRQGYAAVTSNLKLQGLFLTLCMPVFSLRGVLVFLGTRLMEQPPSQTVPVARGEERSLKGLIQQLNALPGSGTHHFLLQVIGWNKTWKHGPTQPQRARSTVSPSGQRERTWNMQQIAQMTTTGSFTEWPKKPSHSLSLHPSSMAPAIFE